MRQALRTCVRQGTVVRSIEQVPFFRQGRASASLRTLSVLSHAAHLEAVSPSSSLTAPVGLGCSDRRSLSGSNSESEEIPVIKIDELKKLMESKSVYLIDVREKDEVHVTGPLNHGETCAENIPLGDIRNGALGLDKATFEEEYDVDQPSKDGLLVFSCRSGVRSLEAARIAKSRHGYTNVQNYKGSALEWFSQN
mmetsp:Transcript_16/g.21  ORF Transcript_16/g.21 Transcript_16/m.21 type:complete len:195 (+) Transcript_16:57-641(+)